MKLAVFGSRTIKDDLVKFEILNCIDEIGADTIVTTQEPLGVCTVAQNLAREEHMVLELHFLNFKYRTGAYEHRSKAVIDSADFVLLIHDGQSHGTRNELEQTKKSGKPYKYVIMEPTDEKTQAAQDRKLPSFGKEKDVLSMDFDMGF